MKTAPSRMYSIECLSHFPHLSWFLVNSPFLFQNEKYSTSSLDCYICLYLAALIPNRTSGSRYTKRKETDSSPQFTTRQPFSRTHIYLELQLVSFPPSAESPTSEATTIFASISPLQTKGAKPSDVLSKAM